MENVLTTNKGEWSELYVLFKLFSNHTIVAADMNLQPTDDTYTFLQILREDVKDRKYTYDLQQEGQVNILTNSGSLIKTVMINDLPQKTQKIFEAIKSSKSSSFTLEQVVPLMSEYEIVKIKASPEEKSDIVAIIKDKVVAKSKPIGFSIKSQVGGASTLLNASKRTNFVFKVNGFSGNIDDINTIGGNRKIRDRLAALIESGASIEFSKVDSVIFTRNLRLTDTILPNILSSMLIDYFLGLENSIKGLTAACGNKQMYDMGEAEVAYKMKSFLRSIALGMVPSKEWNTYLAAYGGYIVVKDDGSLVCYHLYNDDDFKDYLFNNTKFDTSSSTKHDFGKLYYDGDNLMFNLNLMIRFNK